MFHAAIGEDDKDFPPCFPGHADSGPRSGATPFFYTVRTGNQRGAGVDNVLIALQIRLRRHGLIVSPACSHGRAVRRVAHGERPDVPRADHEQELVVRPEAVSGVRLEIPMLHLPPRDNPTERVVLLRLQTEPGSGEAQPEQWMWLWHNVW
jgi:hypothetical protein